MFCLFISPTRNIFRGVEIGSFLSKGKSFYNTHKASKSKVIFESSWILKRRRVPGNVLHWTLCNLILLWPKCHTITSSAPVMRACPGGALTSQSMQERPGPLPETSIIGLFLFSIGLSWSNHAVRTFGFSALPTRSHRNEQINGNELSSAAGRRNGLTGRCCWPHAASSAPTVRY